LALIVIRGGWITMMEKVLNDGTPLSIDACDDHKKHDQDRQLHVHMDNGIL